mmetsp:Transcript_65076/g.136325  ORF Transcript_65076/g.136325 Transcript_65076/m.136325 type:complete len:596 (+) Transcript_65076:127-1914(+)
MVLTNGLGHAALGAAHFLSLSGPHDSNVDVATSLSVGESAHEATVSSASSAVLSWMGAIQKVSPALKCVSALVVAFFGVYLAIVLLRLARAVMWWTTGKNLPISTFERKLSGAAACFDLAPMLSVLMISTRLRSMALDPKRATDPAWWVQWCMYIATGAFFLRVVAEVMSRSDRTIMHRADFTDDGPLGEDHAQGLTHLPMSPQHRRNKKPPTVAQLCHKTTSVIVYSMAFVILLFGSLAIRADKSPVPLSTMMVCMATLVATFLIENLLVEVIETAFKSQWTPHFELSSSSFRMGAPLHFPIMFCVLLVGLEMRAVQLSLQASLWATGAMYLTMISIVAQSMWACVVMLIQSKEAAEEDATTAVTDPKPAARPLVEGPLSYAWAGLLALLYLGTTVTLVGAFAMEARPAATIPVEAASAPAELLWEEANAAWQSFVATMENPAATASQRSLAPLSPAMKCVMLLTLIYFTTYLAMILCGALVGPVQKWADKVSRAVQNAVMFAPMLCVMMISVRLRAMQLWKDDPQPWAQVAMATATASVTVQLLCSFFRIGEKGEASAASKLFHIMMLVLNYIAAGTLLLSVGALVTAIITLA